MKLTEDEHTGIQVFGDKGRYWQEHLEEINANL